MHDTSIDTLLARLKQVTRSHARPHLPQTGEEQADFRFRLSFNGRGAYIETVDKHGKPIISDINQANGERLNALRVLQTINNERMMSINWGEQDDKIYLNNYPHLLYQLLRCDNLVDASMHKLMTRNDPTDLLLLLDEKNDKFTATFGVMTDDGATTGLRIISDQYVLAGHVIQAIKPLNEQYELLPQFAITFGKDSLETYLAALFTYIGQVRVYQLNYKIDWVQSPIPATPILAFEDVDSDLTLTMSLTAGWANDDEKVSTENFDFNVHVDHQHRYINVRPMQQISLQSEATFITGLLQQCCSSRAEARSIYTSEENGYMFCVPPTVALKFLTQALPTILGRYHLIGSDKLHDFKVKPVKPRLNVSLGSGIDFLEGDATVSLGDEQFNVLDILNQYRKNRYITLTDGNRALIDDKFMRRLERIFSNATKKDGKVRISFFDLPEVETMLNERLQGQAVERTHKVFEGFNHLAEQRMKFGQVNATLRNYQKEGVKWINYLYENNLGGCLADDMGLGKTLQAITMLARIYPKVKQPSLLVMPRSLLFNWENELKKFAPQLNFTIYYGQGRDLQEALQSQLVLTTYALVRNDIKQLLEHEFHYIILDESQNIKNVTSQATKAITLLKAKHRLALSGTPIENNLVELYSLFRFLNPTMFGSMQDFNNRYASPIQRNDDQDAASSLRRKVFPFILRRLKRDVLTELPQRTDQTITVEMSDQHKAFYEQRRQFYEAIVHNTMKSQGIQSAQFVMFQALSELRRAASIPESLTEGKIQSAKVEPLLESLLEAVGNGHKAVVFFNFIAGIEMVGDMLTKQGIDFTTMTGSTTDRRAVVERFQNDPQCMVMLMTLKTGGVGLNLTAADTVYIFEPWWNKAAEEQAINRLHRIGQKAKVLSYSIIVHGTIEDKIRQLQQQKANLADAIISSDTAMSKQLSEEDIRFILGK